MTFTRITSLGAVALFAGACTVQQLPPGQYPSTQNQTAQGPQQPIPAPPAQQQPPGGQAGLPPGGQAPPAAQPQGQASPIPRITRRPPAALTDPQIVGVVESFYNARMRLAALAKARGNDPSVRSYASRALQANANRHSQTQSFGIQGTPTSVSTGINQLNEREIGALATQSGNAFDQAYLAREVTDNQHFVQLLDQTLIPNASHVQLRAQLVLLRPQYNADLREASQLRSAVQASAERAGPTPARRSGRATGGEPARKMPFPPPARPAPQRQTPPPFTNPGNPPAPAK